ncbi:MAG: phosphoglycerate kinase [Alteromonas naphthalenivorans]|jgi:phosphoglycerate kinase
MQSQLPKASLKNKRVILRADLNVPRKPDGSIASDFRIKALLPTINLILKKGGKVILLTHCGRPVKKSKKLSTKTLVDWFKKNDYHAVFAPTVEKAQSMSTKDNNNIVIVENLRFFDGEQTEDKTFAQELAALGDYYVNDAFALLHRNNTSITLLPKLFAPNKRTIGLLIEKELCELDALMQKSKSPFVILQGGIKGSTKLLLLQTLLDKADTILISTPLCFSFLKAQNKNVGASFTEDGLLPHIEKFLQAAKEKNVNVVLPIDYQVSSKSFYEPHVLREVTSIQNNDTGVSIGPKTAVLFSNYIKKAKTVFANGLPGNYVYPETLEGTRMLLQALRQTNGLHILAGGDSVALVEKLGFNDVEYLSTGGGATLAYLSGQTLAGLAVFGS